MAGKTNPFDALILGVKQFLSELTDDEYAQLTAEVRPPAEPSADPGGQDKQNTGTPNDNSYPANWKV